MHPSAPAPRQLWIIPPHRDSTLTAVEVPGWSMLDLQRAFCDRLLSPAALAAAAANARAALREAEAPQLLLELEAARWVLGRERAGVHARLRAQGVALAALTRFGPLQLTLDDVQLPGGSTERSADLRAFAQRQDTPFEPELQRAVEGVRGAARVRLLVDCDQRLPFAFALLQRLSGEERARVQLCGRFVERHRNVLGSQPGWEGVQLLDVAPGFQVSAGLAWRWEGTAAPDSPWAGYLSAAALAHAPAECQVAVVPFLALEPQRLLSLEGEWLSRPQLERPRPGLRVVGEWHFGAPTVDAAAAEQTVRLLEDPGGFDWVGGLRRFHWGGDRGAPPTFAGQPLRLGEPAPTLDLGRGVPVLAPAGMEEEALHLLVRGTLARLSAGARPPSPGRVGGGLSTLPPPPLPAGSGTHLVLAEEAALVELPATMEGKPQPTLVGVNLRTGGMLALDVRLRPHLAPLEQPLQTAEALVRLPPAQRERMITVLRERGILSAVAEPTGSV